MGISKRYNVTVDDEKEIENQEIDDFKLKAKKYASALREGALSSVDKLLTSNLTQFFVGGASVSVTPSTKNGYADIVITNPTSRSSLLLHLADNYKRNNKGNVPLTSITQKIHFELKIEDSMFKK